MIGVTNVLRRIVPVNPVIVPTFTTPTTMTSTNSSGGGSTGTFTFQLNSNKRTCTTNTTGAISGSGASSFTYFGVSDLVDPADYEVMVTLGTNVGNSNITTAGGSATLGVWISLSSSPLYVFVCSDRRGGSRPMTVAIRHKVSTGTTASTNITMNQSSDAVAPTFSGLTGTTTLTRTTTNSYLGLYVDNGSSANAGRIRTYKESTIDTNIGFTFSTGSIPESEYEYFIASSSVSPGGSMTLGGLAGSWQDIADRALIPPTRDSGGRYWAVSGSPAGVGVMQISIRHKLDTAKSATTTKTFQTF